MMTIRMATDQNPIRAKWYRDTKCYELVDETGKRESYSELKRRTSDSIREKDATISNQSSKIKSLLKKNRELRRMLKDTSR